MRVAIIGAGASGLPAIKCCLDEGLEPVCFERTDDIGGLWRYTDDIQEKASVMRSTVINTSKEIMAYSDYPIPDDYPNFMHNTYVQEYLRQYAMNFDLLKRIRFGVEVKQIRRADDYEKSGAWSVEWRGRGAEQSQTERFDAVMLCTGHHAAPNKPAFAGLDRFKGSCVHSHDYKTSAPYADKRVLVIGVGNSGGDIAKEIGTGRFANRVFLSTRRGTWIINRQMCNGLPMDIMTFRRYNLAIMDFVVKYMGVNAASWLAQLMLSSRIDIDACGLKPSHAFLSQHPFVNDDIQGVILTGGITVKPNVAEFSESGVRFEDGTFETLDSVILCTGYRFGFPYVEPGVVDVSDNRVDLYELQWPVSSAIGRHNTLCVIGCIQPTGAIFPISELQSRWAARVFAARVSLPDKNDMKLAAQCRADEMAQRYIASTRHTIQVDFVPFMDGIAKHVGCMPNFAKLLLTDPTLGWACLTGPVVPYLYRLEGPHKWSGARKAILTTMERVMAPLRTSRRVASKSVALSSWVLLLVVGLLLLCVVCLFC